MSDKSILPRRSLGATGLDLPRLGFGVSGPHATRFVSESTTMALIAQALNAGVEWFDTAPFYGEGEAERRLGLTLGASDMPAFVSTKSGTWQDGAVWRKDFSPSAIEAALEASLSRLGSIDALYLHGPKAADLTDPLLATLETLKSTGAVRFVGVAGRGRELEAAVDCDAMDLLMAPCAVGISNTLAKTLAKARRRGMGIVGIEAMGETVRGPRWPRRPADLWYLAHAVARRSRRDRTATPTERLAQAFEANHADVVLTVTTRPENLAANVETARNA